ncbi:EIN3-binding F-box protein 1 [Ananas comosus]|uniref:EIN3-binding F-box protein 1 n=1 Tax=Ananas comosus TaxID=4615 RepID=A0A199V578_ANACO|nr:EIN3-binding F-box protein 1 [Ananas comosus]
MPALVNYGGNDDICPGGLFFSHLPHLTDSSFFLSEAPPKLDLYCPPRKRSRVTAPFILTLEGEKVCPKDEQQQKPCSLDTLPDECLFEILRQLPDGSKERSISACVSKRWLTLLSSIRASEITECQKFPHSHGEYGPEDDDNDDDDDVGESNGHLTRSLMAKEATDVRLAAIAIGTGSQGGLGKLLIQGSHPNPTRGVTDLGLSAIARGCPSLRVLSLWSIPLITDVGLAEIADGCPMLEKLDLTHCPLISDKGLIAVAQKCPNLTSLTLESCAGIVNEGLQAVGRYCLNLKSLSIKNCPLIGDQGVSGLVSSASTMLARIKLQGLNISDVSLAVVGCYGKAVTDLTLTSLQNIGERGFWVMANALGLQKLKCITITSCCGVTDLGLASIAKCCPSLKQLSLRRCFYLSDAGLKAFAESARALENLQLEECNRITLAGVLGSLLNCSQKMKTIALVKCLGIKDIITAWPGQLPSCSSLRSLTIRDCPGFTDASLAMVGMICPQLEHIELSGLFGVTDNGILPLIESSEKGLVKVNLSDCMNLTDAAITALVKAHGGSLQLLNLDGCRKVTDKSVLAIADSCCVLDELDLSRCMISDYGVAVLASARQLELRILSLAGCSQVTQKSVPFLGNIGQSLVGLNLQHCNIISIHGIVSLEEKLWWCDILS